MSKTKFLTVGGVVLGVLGAIISVASGVISEKKMDLIIEEKVTKALLEAKNG